MQVRKYMCRARPVCFISHPLRTASRTKRSGNLGSTRNMHRETSSADRSHKDRLLVTTPSESLRQTPATRERGQCSCNRWDTRSGSSPLLHTAFQKQTLVEVLRNANVWLFYGPSTTLDSTWLVGVSTCRRTSRHSRGCFVAAISTRNCTDWL